MSRILIELQHEINVMEKEFEELLDHGKSEDRILQVIDRLIILEGEMLDHYLNDASKII